LLVRETNNVPAPRVSVQVVASDPPPDPDGELVLPTTLRWTSGEQEHNLTGNDKANVLLVEWVQYAQFLQELDYTWGFAPHVAPGRSVTLTLRVFVDGYPNSDWEIEVAWAEGDVHPTVRSKP
jgi:hypothetical protein